MPDYKPYTLEWSRKRYLSEALQKYFEDDVPAEQISEDIVDILEQWSLSYKRRANKLQDVLDNLN